MAVRPGTKHTTGQEIYSRMRRFRARTDKSSSVLYLGKAEYAEVEIAFSKNQHGSFYLCHLVIPVDMPSYIGVGI